GFDPAAAEAAVRAAGYRPLGLEAEDPAAPRQQPGSSGFDYDLLILGSGSAAFAAAIEARDAGARVGMVERGTVGGTCVNIGCVPSKFSLRAAEVAWTVAHPGLAGIAPGPGSLDPAALAAERRELVEAMRRSKYEDLLGDYGIDLLRGEARFLDPVTVAAGARTVRAGRILVATGARPAVPPVPGLDRVPFLTSTEALALDRVPASLIILGGGFVGLELGQFFRRAGAEVTMLLRGRSLLGQYSPETGATLLRALEGEGLRFRFGTEVLAVEGDSREVCLRVRREGREEELRAGALLVATGRLPQTEGLDLPAAGLAPGPRGEVVTGPDLATANARIYAAGDVTGGPQFVYVAAYEGKLAARNALGLDPAPLLLNLEAVPQVMFTDPGVAAVGWGERQARAAGLEVVTATVPLEAVARAQVNRAGPGFIRMVAEAAGGRIRGVEMVGPEAGEVIYAATLAVKAGLTVDDLAGTFAPYLTMAEGLRLAALAFAKDVSRLSCCAG
ncbi:MAG: mercury(II) reductase, partial [Firmicutes bacterium]|nr:mercury(II) reductase [Bacillota bacterium]